MFLGFGRCILLPLPFCLLSQSQPQVLSSSSKQSLLISLFPLYSVMNSLDIPHKLTPKTPHSHLQAVRHGQKWDPGQLSELGDLYAGQGSMCPFVCAFLSQLFHYLAARPWNISSFHEPLSDAPPCCPAFWSTFWRLGPEQ